MKEEQLHYLEQLSEMYPTIIKASSEIINLQAILNLPKGTEHFLSDIHGEYEAFSHVLKNGSGAVRKKIEDVFGTTISDDIINSRVKYAKHLLFTTDITASAISRMCGYNSDVHFMRLFKKTTGITPPQYKKSIILGTEEMD